MVGFLAGLKNPLALIGLAAKAPPPPPPKEEYGFADRSPESLNGPSVNGNKKGGSFKLGPQTKDNPNLF